MPGFRVRINDLPEQPGERKISLHWLFLPLGLGLLIVGFMGLRDYLRLSGPPPAELHVLELAGITNVVAEPEIPGSTRIDNLWLQAPDGAKIRYRVQFPYSSEVRNLNPDFGLLLDTTNVVWAVTTRDGEVLARSYFEEYNIEAKSIGKYFGSFLALLGFALLFCFVVCEKQRRLGGPLPPPVNPVRVRQLILWGSILGYLIFFTALLRFLGGKVPGWVLGLIWVLGGGLIGNGIVAYFRKHPPKGA